MNDSKVVTILLNQVLMTCRSKSHVSVTTWHKLQKNIENFLENSPVDIEDYKIEKIKKIYLNSEASRKLISDNSILRQKNESLAMENNKLKKQNTKYSQAERGIKSILSELAKVKGK